MLEALNQFVFLLSDSPIQCVLLNLESASIIPAAFRCIHLVIEHQYFDPNLLLIYELNSAEHLLSVLLPWPASDSLNNRGLLLLLYLLSLPLICSGARLDWAWVG